jgi:hypothetical protein
VQSWKLLDTVTNQLPVIACPTKAAGLRVARTVSVAGRVIDRDAVRDGDFDRVRVAVFGAVSVLVGVRVAVRDGLSVRPTHSGSDPACVSNAQPANETTTPPVSLTEGPSNAQSTNATDALPARKLTNRFPSKMQLRRTIGDDTQIMPGSAVTVSHLLPTSATQRMSLVKMFR